MTGADYFDSKSATTSTNWYFESIACVWDSINDLIDTFWQCQDQADQLVWFREFRKEKLFKDITCLKVVKPEIRKANQKPTFWWEAWQQ